jgi:shikimate kinase
MSYYIIIRGPLGIGKSTVAKKLSEILNAKYIDIDSILKKKGLDKVDKDMECIPAKNFIKADEIILPKIKENLNKGKIVIFDACFYHKDHIEHIIQNLSYPHYIFTLKAPLEVCIERDSKRKKTHGKDAATAVHYLVSKFDYGTMIDISKKSIDQAVQEILSYLPKY